MPKAYLIAHIRVRDPEAYQQFKSLSATAIAAYGGKALVRNPDPDHREGKLRGIVIVLEFADMVAAKKFYESPEYTAARVIREAAAETDLMLVEGV